MNADQKKVVALGTLLFTITGIIGARRVPGGEFWALETTIIVWVTIAVATIGIVMLLSKTKE